MLYFVPGEVMNVMDEGLRGYYAARAREYEQIYELPERQGDLAALRELLQRLLSGHDVLEVACGTGYWTLPVSLTARSVLATDVGEEVLELARLKTYPRGNVRFMQADAFTLEGVEGRFSAGFASFWWSHIAMSKLDAFLEAFHGKLGPGSLVVFTDNNYVDQSSRPIVRQDSEGNTYQLRRLNSGAEYEVLKNFPSEDELRDRLRGLSTDVEVVSLTYYWCLSYRVA
ncbi:MAG: class I SAM-dependent methyltransferase [Chloroflexia bacterium]